MVVAIIVGLVTAVTMATITAVWLLGRASDRAEITQHTKAAVLEHIRTEFGDSKYNLYGAIGDALDQKSSWRKTMDVLFEILDDNPDLMLDYLVERHGVDGVLEALSQYESGQ